MKTNTKYLIVAIAYGLILIGLAFCMSGCMTFDKARLRYATTHVDTTYQTVTLTVPKDSAVLRVHTDTTHLVEVMKQGKATVTIIREPTYTTVRADCEGDTLTQKVVVQTVTQKWGVDPKYQKQASRWQTVSFVLIGLLIVGVLTYLLLHKFQLSLTKR